MTKFGDLMRFHLESGTRPGPMVEGKSRRWSSAEFAAAIGASPRTIRNWKAGDSLPVRLDEIEEGLFGSDQTKQVQARQELREAWSDARSAASEPTQDDTRAVSNVPVLVPLHFVGRSSDLAAIDTALKGNDARVAIVALHGLRGVGKTTLAAAYAEQQRANYRTTWWIRAGAESTMRADLVALGVRLNWINVHEREENGLALVMDRLRSERSILLIYDNATNVREIKQYMPSDCTAEVIVTSNAPDWRGIAAPVEIGVWPKEVGADYLIARTGRDSEHQAALALSDALGGLPLAHEQAAAYCERVGISFADYLARYEATPVKLLDAEKDAPAEYYDRTTVAKTITLAIEEAAKLHYAAEPLIVYASLLAPEPIPLFLFSEAREQFGAALESAFLGDSLDEAVAALRAFALLDREAIRDERYPAITTDCIRLHRLVRQVAAGRCEGDSEAQIKRACLIAALAQVYQGDSIENPNTWPRARRLDALAMAMVAGVTPVPNNALMEASYLLDILARYRQNALAAYGQARPLAERALAFWETVFGRDCPESAVTLNNLGAILQEQGDLAGARSYFERALAISENPRGRDNAGAATSLNNLGYLLESQGDLTGARSYHERALAIREEEFGPDHSDTATSLNNLGHLLQVQGELAVARSHYERALMIFEEKLGAEHPDTVASLNNLGHLLETQGDLTGARSCHERALAIREKAFGPDHPDTGKSLYNLGAVLESQGEFAGARAYFERALIISEKFLGTAHPSTKTLADNTVTVLEALKSWKEAKAVRKKFGLKDQEKV